ncbi:hypothetical protein V498_07347 [Pseudogymnoascus sp. VKM F-4517 (FW-2822)]|nr:hypothetical protein V498_07347 [Pseudogymnoascus sp. VKM F-4517 (FW-2822)]
MQPPKKKLRSEVESDSVDLVKTALETVYRVIRSRKRTDSKRASNKTGTGGKKRIGSKKTSSKKSSRQVTRKRTDSKRASNKTGTGGKKRIGSKKTSSKKWTDSEMVTASSSDRKISDNSRA